MFVWVRIQIPINIRLIVLALIYLGPQGLKFIFGQGEFRITYAEIFAEWLLTMMSSFQDYLYMRVLEFCKSF